MPTSAAEASPGPLTTQPMTATVMGLSTALSRSSTWVARPMRSIRVRPQVGQDTSSGPSFRTPAALRMSRAAYTSSTGSAERDTRRVSPIPMASKPPMPTADLRVPMRRVPVSVTPRCKG